MTSPPGQDQQWEYFVLYIEVGALFGPNVDPRQMEESFNNVGSEGWELVNMISINKGHGNTGEILATFKRPY